jgi:hypothetical protein
VGETDNIVLCAGDILYDTITGDIAILLAREKQWSYKWSYYAQESEDSEEEEYGIWVWRLFWVPPDRNKYTEESLLRMVETGRLILYKAGQ